MVTVCLVMTGSPGQAHDLPQYFRGTFMDKIRTNYSFCAKPKVILFMSANSNSGRHL